MTPERIAALQDMGFVFDPRANRKSTTPTRTTTPAADVVGSMQQQGSPINPSSGNHSDPISGNEKHDDDDDDGGDSEEGGQQYFV